MIFVASATTPRIDNTVITYSITLRLTGEAYWRPYNKTPRTSSIGHADVTVRVNDSREAWVSFIQLHGRGSRDFENLDTFELIYQSEPYLRTIADRAVREIASLYARPLTHRDF